MISVITPHYNRTNAYLAECYESLQRQTVQEWEWIIVINNGGVVSLEIQNDKRVVCVHSESDKIGALKRLGFEQGRGDILVELDADDILMPDCLAELQAAFDNDDVAFAYSNSAQFTDQTWKAHRYSEYWGWISRPFVYEGHALWEMVGFEAGPASMRAIYWCPNHVRAWRATDYAAIGGHNVELAVIDDYELLCRTYLYGKRMLHIDKCLYLYREYQGQATKERNPAIQAANRNMYAKYIIPMAQTWAKLRSLPMLDLGGAFSKPKSYTSLDLHDADMICDLREGIPYPDSSVGIIRAYDFLEHIADSVQIMNEIHRVLVPGGWLLASVPSTDGRGAFQDPTHVSYWNENSFWYYTKPTVAKYVPEITARFQTSRVITWFPSEWHKQHNISYVDAQLIAVKPGYCSVGTCPGENLWRNNAGSKGS